MAGRHRGRPDPREEEMARELWKNKTVSPSDGPTGRSWEEMSPEEKKAAKSAASDFDQGFADHVRPGSHYDTSSSDEETPKGGFFSRLFGG